MGGTKAVGSSASRLRRMAVEREFLLGYGQEFGDEVRLGVLACWHRHVEGVD